MVARRAGGGDGDRRPGRVPGAALGEHWVLRGLRGLQADREAAWDLPKHHDRVDPADLPGLDGAPRSFVEFTHPLCSECREWEQRLLATGDPLLKVDVRDQPELAEKYGIAIVPTVVAIAPDGAVLERLAP